MIRVRRADERGKAEHGWLSSRHTFSFGEYYDPSHMGFRQLRVINEDRVQPGKGFPTHAHSDMEIVTWVLDGALEHEDSLGNGSVIRPGDIQRMSAGTGVTHSEFNSSRAELVHFLQIWVLPEARGLPPGYEQQAFPDTERRARLRLIGSRDGRERSVTIHQDVGLYATLLAAGEEVAHVLRPGRHAWVQVARGTVALNGHALEDGDGAAVSDEARLELLARTPAELLLFDLA
jgi:hypothetical protein